MHDTLLQAAAARQAGRSYLICAGSPAVADGEARAFLRTLFCKNGTGCGQCAGCRKADSGEHVDLHIVASNKVADVRGLQEFAARHPFEASIKAVYIPRADLLTEQAQNAVLKVVEEPPGDTVFVLGAVHRRSVLPTILSRCTIVDAEPDAADAAQRLSQESSLDVVQAEMLVRTAGGDYETARMLRDNGYIELRDRAAEAVRRLIRARSRATSKIEGLLWQEKGDLQLSLQAALLCLQDILALKYLGSSAAIVNMDLREQLSAESDAVDRAITGAVEGIQDLMERMGACQALSRRLALQSALLKILEDIV